MSKRKWEKGTELSELGERLAGKMELEYNWKENLTKEKEYGKNVSKLWEYFK